MKHRALMIAPLALLVAGCQTWSPTWSEVSGTRYHVALLNRQPTVIEKIDGNSAYPSRPIKIEPGRHLIEVQGVAQRPAAGGGTLKTITLDIAPCKRYYINAQYARPVDVDFEAVIDYVDDVPGCRSTG